jgi:hypothetical protein
MRKLPAKDNPLNITFGDLSLWKNRIVSDVKVLTGAGLGEGSDYHVKEKICLL